MSINVTTHATNDGGNDNLNNTNSIFIVMHLSFLEVVCHNCLQPQTKQSVECDLEKNSEVGTLEQKKTTWRNENNPKQQKQPEATETTSSNKNNL